MDSPDTRSGWFTGDERSHTVYRFTDEIFKFVQWYSVRERFGPGPKDQQKHYDKKLDSSISRTRRLILEKALCNQWDWFCTFTIAEDKYDRHDLENWHKKFTQWLRDCRKKNKNLRYLLVPEQHKDGAWHAHGFLAGLDESELISFKAMHKQGVKLKRQLWKSNYMNWPAYQKKFGFCSLGKIKNPVSAGFYVTKYITKDNQYMVQGMGLNSYYASQKLNKAEKFVDFYGRDPEIDRLLVNKYDFCATGMTHLRDRTDWETKCMALADASEYTDFRRFQPLDFWNFEFEDEKSAPEIEADDYYEFEQIALNW